MCKGFFSNSLSVLLTFHIIYQCQNQRGGKLNITRPLKPLNYQGQRKILRPPTAIFFFLLQEYSTKKPGKTGQYMGKNFQNTVKI